MGEVTEIKLILHMEELDSSDQKKKSILLCFNVAKIQKSPG